MVAPVNSVAARSGEGCNDYCMRGPRYNRYRGVTIRAITGFYCTMEGHVLLLCLILEAILQAEIVSVLCQNSVC